MTDIKNTDDPNEQEKRVDNPSTGEAVNSHSEQVSLEDLPLTSDSEKRTFVESIQHIFQISKILLIDLLDLKHIERHIPKAILDKIPENRRLFTLPIFIFFLGFVIIFLLAIFSPTANKKTNAKFIPTVRVLDAEKTTIRIPVYSQGVVNPKNEIRLVSLVNGPVKYVSPNFTDGGVVHKGELLMAVSDRTYQQDKARVEASLARAKSGQIAKRSELRVRGTLRSEAGKAQLREVNAAVKAAEADVERIDDLIANTKFKAPFSGIIRGGGIRAGQMLSAGTPIASIFTTEAAVISLPLSDRQLALIDLPDVNPVNDTTEDRIDQDQTEAVDIESEQARQESLKLVEKMRESLPKVKITGEFGDRRFTWNAVLVRSTGGRNELNRLQYVVVEILRPYDEDPAQPGRPPLSPGFFVQAEIEGREFVDIVRLPRSVLKSNQKIWGVDENNLLTKFEVDLLNRGKNYIYVASGIEDGAKVVLSDLGVMAKGIEVKVVYSEKPKKIDKKNIVETKTAMEKDAEKIIAIDDEIKNSQNDKSLPDVDQKSPQGNEEK